MPFGGDAVDGATGGSPRRRLALHRRRERRLRDLKLQDHLDRGLGLACEVPGCGFDFHKSYGELGRGYAHVHHLRPLGARVEDEATNLGDLAIVCANCYAMIHRGRQCRPLVGLVPRGPTLIRPAVIADEGHVTELAAEFGKFGDYVPVFLRMLHHRHPIGYGVGQDVEL